MSKLQDLYRWMKLMPQKWGGKKSDSARVPLPSCLKEIKIPGTQGINRVNIVVRDGAMRASEGERRGMVMWT